MARLVRIDEEICAKLEGLFNERGFTPIVSVSLESLVYSALTNYIKLLEKERQESSGLHH